MASLTETAYYTRRAINWAILALIAYIILRFLWSIFFSIWLVVFPPKAPPPNHAFGKLPALKFPTPVASPSGSLVFRLETIEGSVPKASPSATVYFMPKNPPNFLGIPRTQAFATRLGFDPTPIAESKNVYRFVDPTLPLRQLHYDIVSNNFVLLYSFAQDAVLFTNQTIPSPEETVAQGKNILQTYDLYHDDLAGGPTNTSFLKLIGNQLVPTTSASQANVVRVDFFRNPLGDMRFLGSTPGQSSIFVLFSGSKDEKKQVLQLTYTYWPIDYTTSATYALKSSYQAWQELQSGGGYIAQYPASGNTITVRSVYLAYYDPPDAQTYLQPIFVFEGDGGFVGYVSAVSPQWTE